MTESASFEVMDILLINLRPMRVVWLKLFLLWGAVYKNDDKQLLA
jgi:hypothetical protein